MALLGFMCPTPPKECEGSLVKSGRGGGSRKLHSDVKQVRRCQKRYLQSLGYTQLSSRAFQRGDGPVQILSKKMLPIKTGKERRTQAFKWGLPW